MTIERNVLKAGAVGAVLATIATIVFFDGDRRDARKWKRHVEYTAKCIDTKEDGSSIDRCMQRREAFALAYEKWLSRCGRFDRPVPADCDRQLQQLE